MYTFSHTPGCSIHNAPPLTCFILQHQTHIRTQVVREHYLRDDISCGSLSCAAGCNLDAAKLETDTSVPYLVIDTNIALHQMDFLEHKCMRNVVVMSTVLEEVKKHNMSASQRLRALTQAPDRSFYIFSNEHHQDTYITAEEGESPNDRNDRAIRTAAMWYKQHLPGHTVILLSNDADNRRKALEGGLQAVSAKEFAAQHAKAFPELVDLVASTRYDLLAVASFHTCLLSAHKLT